MNKKSTYEKEILKVIQDNNLFVIQDIFAFYTGIKSAQFYNLELEKSETIKRAIDDNKVKTKHSLKNKMFHSDNVSAWAILFKLIGTEEERRKLSQVYQTVDGDLNIHSLKLIKASESDSDSNDK